jgi:hypothetical protein
MMAILGGMLMLAMALVAAPRQTLTIGAVFLILCVAFGLFAEWHSSAIH